MTRPIDYESPVEVGATWTGVVEPGDPAAGYLRAALGSVAALRWIYAPDATDPRHLEGGDQLPTNVPWKECHARWNLRANTFDLKSALGTLERLGGYVLVPTDPRWPVQLEDLAPTAPAALWVTGDGDAKNLGETSVALVGARACTAYGRRLTEQLSYELAERQIAVISGGAYGIDAAAHHGAIAAAGPSQQRLSTVAVLCGGLGNPYPSGNRELFNQIRHSGLLISEVPPHWRPARWRFLERNRIIAALADMTVVVEAGVRSGAAATAGRAADLGRDVGAAPGPVTSAVSAGCHRLIQQGAQLVTSVDDILLSLGQLGTATTALGDGQDHERSGPSLNPMLQLVFDALPKAQSAPTESVARVAGLSTGEAGSSLLELQLRGLVTVGEGRWSRADS